MPYRVTEFVTTPNPNALKCVLNASPSPTGPRAFSSVEDAAAHPLADALFGVGGVRGVLLHDGWMTVTKTPEASWRDIKAAVARAIGAVPVPGES